MSELGKFLQKLEEKNRGKGTKIKDVLKRIERQAPRRKRWC